MDCKINYIGSKYSLLPFIEGTIKEVCGDLSEKRFADLFAGTGVVSRLFKTLCSEVISNDIEFYSYVFLKAYIENDEMFDVAHLNEVEPIEGFIFNQYSENGEADRLYFSEYNGKKIDGIRQYIENFDENEYYYYLCSLLEAADKVANTASVYGAFLKKLKKTAQKNICLENCKVDKNENSRVFNRDANKLIKEISGDILYIDPPYNSRQYSDNYHLLNTIAKYDDFIPKGKTGQRKDKVSSRYCSKRFVLSEFNELIKNADFKYIFLSYNNHGLMNKEDIEKVMSRYGDYKLFEKEYTSYKADNKRKYKIDDSTEYLHVLEK